MSRVRFLGLDVHADTIAVAVAEPDGQVRPLGIIPNRLESIRKLVAKLGPVKNLKACYEAGPTGYVVYWQLTALGVDCQVIAPSLVPVKAGDRVKTDRRDAAKLARSFRAGDLTPVWVPDADHEALRDLVRAREDARQDQQRARHRLSKFLLRHGRRPPAGVKKSWTRKYLTWIKEQVHFEQPALEATLLDYVHEIDHMAERLQRLEKAITEAIQKAPPAMRAWVDFAAVKGSVPLASVLRRYEVKLRRSGRDQYRGCCPIHRGQGREAFHANLTKNVFHCFACGTGGTVLDFVAAMEKCSLREAALKLAGQAGPSGNPPSNAITARQLVTKKRSSPSPLGFCLRGVETAHPYLTTRGIERRTAEEFGVGLYRGPGLFSGRLVIPIHNGRGELVAYCGRALDGSEPRYRFPSGFAKSERRILLCSCWRRNWHCGK